MIRTNLLREKDCLNETLFPEYKKYDNDRRLKVESSS